MLEKMEQIVVHVNEVLWGSILIFLLTGTGIFYTFKLRFIQIRKFGQGIQRVTSGFSFHGKDADHNGISSFQALATAVAAQVGTGNLAGAATAIASGDRKSTRLNSSHANISYAVFCLKKKNAVP